MMRHDFQTFMLKRFCNNVTERVMYIMQLPKLIRFDKYLDCCNHLIKLTHESMLKLSFGFYDHDFDDRISVTDGVLMMK